MAETWPRLTEARRVAVRPGLHMLEALEQPGDYYGPVMVEYREDPPLLRPWVYFLLPVARDDDAAAGARSIHGVASPPHTFRECADGSLEIRASIGAGPKPYYWHGYLDEGNIWRQLQN